MDSYIPGTFWVDMGYYLLGYLFYRGYYVLGYYTNFAIRLG